MMSHGVIQVEYSYRFTALTQAPNTVVLWIFPWEPVDKRGGRILLEWVCVKLIRLVFISPVFISQAATDASDLTGTISSAGKSQRITAGPVIYSFIRLHSER